MQLKQLSTRSVTKAIFFGNYFYGLCVAALSVEAGLQQQFPLNSILFYMLSFIATVLYYTRAYLPAKNTNSINPRTKWYADNKKEILLSQWLLGIIFLACSFIYLYRHYHGLLQLPLSNSILLIIFPLVAAFYYGLDHQFAGDKGLRRIGWLKPFIIGFIWAGIVTVYPVVFSGVENANNYYHFNIVGTFLFIKNFMFITVLCIMFDIKDYATDSNQQIKTFVVNVGLRRTIFSIILPLSALGLGSFLIVAFIRGFSPMMILLNLVPFICLITVAYSMYRRQPILYYLMIIDGLMVLKGICGSVAMYFFWR